MAGARTIDEIINEIIENYTKNLKGAAEYASNKATEEIYEHALTCLEQYYSSYSPNIYDRTYHLQSAILPYTPKVTQNTKTVISEVGIEYDASALNGVYSGSKKYNPTDGDWVLENYLRGVHPATNGSSNPDFVEYYEIMSASPYNNMQEYLAKVVPAAYQTRLMAYLIKSIK